MHPTEDTLPSSENEAMRKRLTELSMSMNDNGDMASLDEGLASFSLPILVRTDNPSRRANGSAE